MNIVNPQYEAMFTHNAKIAHSTKEIRAIFDDKTIVVYQAYNELIADEAIKLQRFGSHFKMGRMTWIKPSFLWMMYRSNWASKENQERILAISLDLNGFEYILSKAVKSTFDPQYYVDYAAWKEALSSSLVRVQWDPERNIYGAPIENTRSLQIGIRGTMVERYNYEWIKKIEDITPFVKAQKALIDNKQLDKLNLPQEKLYPLKTKVQC